MLLLALAYVTLNGGCKVNNDDPLNRRNKNYYTVNTWRKCFAWFGSGTKNVPGPDRIDLVPVRNKTRYGSGTITTTKAHRKTCKSFLRALKKHFCPSAACCRLPEITLFRRSPRQDCVLGSIAGDPKYRLRTYKFRGWCLFSKLISYLITGVIIMSRYPK